LNNIVKENRSLIIVYSILLLLFIISSFSSDIFLTSRNIHNMLRQGVILGLVCIGQTFVILGAGLDLSVGSVISLTSCLTTGLIMGRDSMAIPVVILVLIIALAIGFLNGFIITRTGVPPLIVTLGTMTIIQGSVLLYTDCPYGELCNSLRFIAWGKIGFITYPVLLLAIAFIAGSFVLNKTTFGRNIYAVGGNEETARLSGIKTDWVKIRTYMLCSFTAALAGLMMACRMGMGDPVAGEPFMLDSLVPVLIGGTALTGGKGGLMGTLAGLFILTILNNILNLLDVSSYVQWVIQGSIIIVSVIFYSYKE